MRRLQACFAVVGIALFLTLPVRTQTQNETTRLHTGIQLSQEGPMFPFGICLTSQMPRNTDDADSLTALKVQECLQYRRAIVVQEEVVPASLHQFGQNDGDMLFGPLPAYRQSGCREANRLRHSHG
jgi:hypothetical protein